MWSLNNSWMWIVAEIRCQIETDLMVIRKLAAVYSHSRLDWQYTSSIHVTWYVLRSRRGGIRNANKLVHTVRMTVDVGSVLLLHDTLSTAVIMNRHQIFENDNLWCNGVMWKRRRQWLIARYCWSFSVETWMKQRKLPTSWCYCQSSNHCYVTSCIL